MDNLYVIASCKEWHRAEYEKLSETMPGQFAWVENKKQLDDILAAYKPVYIFFLHWNWIVPKEIWSEIECVCFHMTDVPYGRGGSPLQNLIVHGHSTTKLTALRMVEDVDAGPVYMKVDLSLDGTAQEIYQRAGEKAFEVIMSMLRNRIEPRPQVGEPFFFKRRKPSESIIKKISNQKELYDFIRMLDADGYPHAYIEIDGVKLEFKNASCSDGKFRASVEFKFCDNGE